MKFKIGIDFGGTKIKVALVKGKDIIRKIKMPTEAKKGKKKILNNLFTCIDFIIQGIKKSDVECIGIGVPGTLDAKRESVLNLPNIPKFKNVHLKKMIQKRYKIKVIMDNDTNVFAWGEFLYGAGRGYNNLIFLTIGTGLGGGIIINKKLYHGRGNAAELGHITIKADGTKCVCGNRGCLEEYVSTRAIAKSSKKIFGKSLHPLKIEQMGKKGNLKAKKVYRILGEYLGIGLATINNIFDPDAIIIGGSISNAGYLILKPAKEVMKKNTMLKPTKIIKSKLKENAGLIGAANLS
ncbi:MAG: ROK family protein [Nanoarchaeota archaeon]|nr:ROK family protein [Nanoarchaeota archaeon]